MLSYFRKKSTCRAFNTSASRTSIRTSHTKSTIRTKRYKFFFGSATSTWKARAKKTMCFWISSVFEYYIEGWRWSTLTKEINITSLFITHRGEGDREGDAQSSKSELFRDGSNPTQGEIFYQNIYSAYMIIWAV